MNFMKRCAVAVIAIAVSGSSALAAAEPVRPAAISAAGSRVGMPTLRTNARVGKGVAAENSLLGAPLFLLILGGVAVTIGTIVVVSNGDSPASP
jgi:hypothetical protein